MVYRRWNFLSSPSEISYRLKYSGDTIVLVELDFWVPVNLISEPLLSVKLSNIFHG